MHTFKGATRTYGFTLLSEAAHLTETRLSELRSGKQKWQQTLLLDDLQHISNTLHEYIHSFEVLLDRGSVHSQSNDNEAGFWLAQSVLDKVITLVKQDKSNNALSHLLELGYIHVEQALSDTIASLPAMANELGKPAPQVNIIANNLVLNKQYITLVTNVFNHLLSNALDHSIETTEIRQSKAKPAQAQIQITLAEQTEHIEISLTDDGAGLAIHQLYQKGLTNALWQKNKHPNLITVANSVFNQGISTKSTVTEISGRGVGMDAVKHAIEAAGGLIYLRFNELDANQPYSEQLPKTINCSFIISLPKSMFYVITN
jgi:two-component system chemotaxis sensor kinase CheA